MTMMMTLSPTSPMEAMMTAITKMTKVISPLVTSPIPQEGGLKDLSIERAQTPALPAKGLIPSLMNSEETCALNAHNHRHHLQRHPTAPINQTTTRLGAPYQTVLEKYQVLIN